MVVLGYQVMFYFFIYNLFSWLDLKADEESKFKYISFAMGINRLSYWLGTFIFDSLKLAIELWIFLIIYSLCLPSSVNNIFIGKIYVHCLSLLLLSMSFISISYFILIFLKR